MLSQHIPLFMGGSLEKAVGIGVCESELPPVVVVPGGVGTRVHNTHRLSWETASAALGG